MVLTLTEYFLQLLKFILKKLLYCDLNLFCFYQRFKYGCTLSYDAKGLIKTQFFSYTKCPLAHLSSSSEPVHFPCSIAGADLGGGGGRTPFPQGIDPLPTQRVPPLILFKKSIFGRPTIKIF